MPQPYKTTAPDNVGPLQNYPLSVALKECIDLNDQNSYWCYVEEANRLIKMLIDTNNKTDYDILVKSYCGVRSITLGSICYTTMALSSEKMANQTETPEQAYDRAMSVIGKR